MKIRNCMALICAVVALSACGRTVIMREGNSSEEQARRSSSLWLWERKPQRKR